MRGAGVRCTGAGVVELADTRDLKSRIPCGCTGSTPVAGTIPMESTDSMGIPLHWTSSGGVNPPCGNSAPPRFTADSRRRPMESTDSMGTPLHWTSSGGVNPPCGNSALPRFTADSRRPWNPRIPWGSLFIGHRKNLIFGAGHGNIIICVNFNAWTVMI